MKKNSDFCIKNNYFETLFDSLSTEVQQRLTKNYAGDSTEIVNSVILILSEIAQLATTKEKPKTMGSTDKGETGNKALIKIQPIPQFKRQNFIADEINKNEESYFYSLLKWGQQEELKFPHKIDLKSLKENLTEFNIDELHEIFKNQTKQSFKLLLHDLTEKEKKALNSALDPNKTKNYKNHDHLKYIEEFIDQLNDDELFMDIRKLNENLDEIKISINKYNSNLKSIKRLIIASKHDKAHLYFIERLNLYFDSIEVCADLIQKSLMIICQTEDPLMINSAKIKMILKDCSNYITKECKFKEICTSSSCNCPLINGFKRCLNPPVCEKCGYEQEVVEKSADSFMGYEFYNDADFCYSVLGIKKTSKKKKNRGRSAKKNISKNKLKKNNIELPKKIIRHKKIKR